MTGPAREGGSPLAGLGRAGDGAQPGLLDSVGGRDVLLDSGLPALVFVVVFSLGGVALVPSLVVSVAVGLALGVVRIVRHDPLQNVLAGLAGLAVSAVLAARTGRAQDVFLPGILVNLAYLVGYVVSIAVRWPLLGVFVALVRREDMSWRKDPALLRAYALASWVWVVMFALRLAVKVPLYLMGSSGLVALGVVNIAMGWPLFFLCLWLSYLVIARAVRRHDVGAA